MLSTSEIGTISVFSLEVKTCDSDNYQLGISFQVVVGVVDWSVFFQFLCCVAYKCLNVLDDVLPPFSRRLILLHMDVEVVVSVT